MIYNTAVKAETVNESTSLLQNMLYIAESEGKMFDSLINIDFMDALNEADLSDQEEDYETGNGATQPDQDTGDAPKKRIWDVIKEIAKKIWELLKKAGEAIANAFKSLAAKVGEIVGTNKGLVAKYGKYVTDSKYLDGCPELENFPTDSDIFNFDKELFETTNESFRHLAQYLNNEVADLPDQTAEQRKTTLEKFEQAQNDLNKELGEDHQEIFVTGKVKPNPDLMKKIVTTLDNSKGMKSAIENGGKEALQLIDVARQSAKKQESKVESKIREKADPDYAAAWKDYYAALSQACRFISRTVNTEMSTMKQIIKFARHAMIVVGKYAYDKARGELKSDAKEGKNANLPKEAQVNPNESVAFAQLLGLASDVYVESVFEM